VDEKSGSHVTFESLAKAFFSFFQLPVRHDTGLELLSKFKQTTVIHIVLTTSMNGVGDVVCVKKKPPKNNASIGFLNRSSLSLPKM
jgi:hypothetical protein